MKIIENRDVNGNELSRGEEARLSENYRKEKKSKEWNFPFYFAFKKLGIVK